MPSDSGTKRFIVSRSRAVRPILPHFLHELFRLLDFDQDCIARTFRREEAQTPPVCPVHPCLLTVGDSEPPGSVM